MPRLKGSRGASPLLLHCKDKMGLLQHGNLIEFSFYMNHICTGASRFGALVLFVYTRRFFPLATSHEPNDLVMEHLADRLPDLPAGPLTGCVMALWLTGRLTD